MKKWLPAALTGLMVAPLPALASVVHYQFTGNWFQEMDAASNPVAAGDTLLSGTGISGTLDYDNSAAASYTDVPPAGGLAMFGPLSVYSGAITNLSGNVGGYTFGADSGTTLVADGAVGGSLLDGVFNLAGSFPDGDAGTGFSGFGLGDYSLTSFNLFSSLSSDTLSSQALPDQLLNGGFFTGINLIFENSNQDQRIVQFSANVEPAPPVPVPLPSTLWLFGSSFIGWILCGRKKAH